MQLKKEIIAHSKKIGFDLIGFAKAKIPPQHLKAFQKWLEKGHEGGMAYMQKIDQRANLNKILPGAKTVISLAINYYHDQPPLKKNEGRVARYAYGRDYHKIIKKKLKKLENFIKEIAPGPQQGSSPQGNTKAYVDTGPVLERALAEEAGIGTIGKNSCLITEEYGSWVFLAEIITTLEIEPDKKLKSKKDFSACGGCRRCIDACPTGAIIAPGVIDSRRCLSYLTIEHKGKIPKKFQKAIAITKRIYGCDICQEVCPHNIKRARITAHQDLQLPKIAGNSLKQEKILALKTDQDYLERFAGSATMRAKRAGMQRNLRACLPEGTALTSAKPTPPQTYKPK